MSRLGEALSRLRGHETHVEIVTKRLRDHARFFEELANMSHGNALAATWAAMGADGPPTPEHTRRQTWADRPRLLERAAALGEVASAIRCELTMLKRGGRS